MKKIFNLISSLLIILLSFSCSFNILEEKSQGALSFTLPGNSSLRAASDEMGPPSEYFIEISSQKGSYKKSDTYPAGATIVIEDIPLGKVDITIQGQNLRYGYFGTAQAEIIAKETTAVNIPLNKFLLPIYANSSTGSDADGNGSMQKPYASINKAIAEFVDLGSSGVVFIDGTFDEQPNPCKYIHIEKAPNASKAEIKTGNYSIDNGTFEFIDINFIDSSITLLGSSSFRIGGSTKFTGTSDITLSDSKVLEICAPLTSENVATLKIRATAPTQVLLPVTKSVNIADEYNRFKLSVNENNKYAISKEGLYIENKKLSLVLNSPNLSKSYTYKIKEKGADEYLFPEASYSSPDSTPVLISDYYFNVGKTYTVEIYESGTSTPIRSADITIEENDSLNKAEFDLNVIYVSSTGDDSNDGSSKATAFKTLDKAVTAASDKALIKVYGSVDIQSPVTVDKNLKIKGFENAALDSNIDQAILVNDRQKLTLETIIVNGNVKLGDAGAGYMLIKDGTTFNTNNTITVVTGQLTIEGSAKAGKIDLQVDGGLKVIGTLTESNAGTVTVNMSSLNDGDSILVADKPEEITANLGKFTFDGFSDTEFEIRNDGQLHPISPSNIAAVLAKHTTSPTPIDLRAELTNSNDYTTAKTAITGGNVDVNLEIISTLYEMPSQCFENCTHLKKVTLSPKITYIRSNAFNGCKSLTEINLSNVTYIDDYAFWECTNLTSIVDISKVDYFGTAAFSDCENLVEIPAFNNSVRNFGDTLFRGCTKLTIGNKKLPDNLTQIPQYAFAGCNNLELDKLPDNLQKIYKNAFASCTKLTILNGTQNSVIPSTVTYIDDSAFYQSGIKGHITIPNGITTILKETFRGCSGITAITLPDTLTSIGQNVFVGTGITELVIPQSVTSIGDNLFYETNISTLTTPVNLSFDGNTRLTDVKIVAGASVSTIVAGSFNGCTALSNVTIGNGITKIESHAFTGCNNISSVVFEDTSKTWTTQTVNAPENIPAERDQNYSVTNTSSNASKLKNEYMEWTKNP